MGVVCGVCVGVVCVCVLWRGFSTGGGGQLTVCTYFENLLNRSSNE